MRVSTIQNGCHIRRRQTQDGAAAKISRRHRRGGYLYLSVMGVAVIVSMVGMSAITLARLQLNHARIGNDASDAKLLAVAAVEAASATIHRHAVLSEDWRTMYQNDTEYPSPAQPLGGGTFTWKLADADGDLADDDSDFVRIYGYGRVGNITHVETALLQPVGTTGQNCLEVALHCDTDIIMQMWSSLTTDQIISSNQRMDASAWLASINSNVEAVETISGNITGSQTTGITARKMPDVIAMEYYRNNGTWIDFADLTDLGWGTRGISKAMLSPATNPYGTQTNPEGIYVVDCNGGTFCVKNSRIVGTLVLIDSGPMSSVSSSVHLEAAVANYPALLVDGNITFSQSNLQLDEAFLWTNFNPPGTPYQASEDSDLTDSYPSAINGLVAVWGTLSVASMTSAVVDGVVVTQAIWAGNGLDVTYRSTYLDNPPPGFAAGPEVELSRGSWRWEATP